MSPLSRWLSAQHKENVVMTDLTHYSFESQEVRVLEPVNEDPWFVLADVLQAMGTSTPVTKAVAAIEQGFGDGFTSVQPIVDSLGRTQQVTIVKAPGVTFLTSRSNTENGRRLNRWVHAEVLPSIHKTGGYSVDIPKSLPDALRAYALEVKKSERHMTQTAARRFSNHVKS
jgi:prophage antirepressor-like protein